MTVPKFNKSVVRIGQCDHSMARTIGSKKRLNRKVWHEIRQTAIDYVLKMRIQWTMYCL